MIGLIIILFMIFWFFFLVYYGFKILMREEIEEKEYTLKLEFNTKADSDYVKIDGDQIDDNQDLLYLDAISPDMDEFRIFIVDEEYEDSK